MIKKIKLRTRLTLLMALVLFCACSILTFTLVTSADKIYQPLTAKPTQTGSIVEGYSNSGVENTQKEKYDKELRVVSLISIISVFIIGVGATYIIAAKALRPITKLSREIEKIDENNLFVSVQETQSNDEIAALSTTFNNMIGKLEKAFASQKQFSANAAHELKTPLAAIITKIEVCQLDENPSTQEYKKTVDDVLQSAERLNALINDLLEMYADDGLRNNEAFDLREMFCAIIDEISKTNPKSVTFDNQIGALDLIGNRDLLYRAFLNITHNAAKYNKPNGTVTLSAQSVAEGIRVIVVDTGIGIPSDQLEKIFDPFYCVDKSRSRVLGGNGLGLSLVKTIIEKHGGEIAVESEVGVSTTISVILQQ